MLKKAAQQPMDTSPSRFVLSGKLFYGHLHPDFPDTAFTPRWGLALSLDKDMQKLIRDSDILMIPAGGVYTIAAAEAIKVMAQVEPKITIPMHYQIPELKIKLLGIDKFLKGLGIKKLEPLPKLSIKKKDLSSEEAKIIVLQP